MVNDDVKYQRGWQRGYDIRPLSGDECFYFGIFSMLALEGCSNVRRKGTST